MTVSVSDCPPTSELAQAVEACLPQIFSDPGLAQTERPGQVFWWTYEVLRAAGSSQAGQVLQLGFDQLTLKAERLGSSELAAMFWANIPAHRALRTAMREFERST